jgi:microcystin-dependent protein
MPAAPLRTALADTYPNPSNSVFRTGIGALWDFVTGLLGTTGNKEDALAALRAVGANALLNISLVPSVGSNALTVTTKTAAGATPVAADPVMLAQRHATIGNGSFNLRTISAANALVISSGSTLGHASGFGTWIYTYQIDNGGTQEPAVSSTYFGPSGIITTVAEGGAGAADSASVMYSAAARSNVPFRCTGRMYSLQTTAGTWAALPSVVEVWPLFQAEIPSGVQFNYAGAGAVPYGYLACDGSNVSRATYGALFAAIGTTWGVGDGSTTFGLPDSRRRVAVGSGGSGSGTLGNAVGNTGGAETHTLITAEMPAHTHANGGSNTLANPSSGAATSNAVQTNAAALTDTTGGGGSHNNLQPSYVVQKIIKI